MQTDFEREISTCTAEQGAFSVVDLPPSSSVAIDGHGDPNTSPAYADALAALHPWRTGAKLLSKTELDRDDVVMPLAAL